MDKQAKIRRRKAQAQVRRKGWRMRATSAYRWYTNTNEPQAKPILPHPIAVEPRANYHIWLRYSDGVEGELDVRWLACQGRFKDKDGHDFFDTVFIRDANHYIIWKIPDEDDEMVFEPDTCYANLLGISREEVSAIPSTEGFFAAVEQVRKDRRLI